MQIVRIILMSIIAGLLAANLFVLVVQSFQLKGIDETYERIETRLANIQTSLDEMDESMDRHYQGLFRIYQEIATIRQMAQYALSGAPVETERPPDRMY